MKKNSRLTGIISFAMVAVFVGQSVGLASESQQNVVADAPKFALLVGVNDYAPNSGIRNLSGTHNDVLLMKSLLVEKGFKEDPLTPASKAHCGTQKETSGVKTLCSAQATKSAILAAFDKHLIGNAKAYWNGATPDPGKGPMVFFYYSGHGSQVRDAEPIAGETKASLMVDEADGLDETLVPHDTDMDGSRDIRDDSFKTRVDELKTYTSNIVIMADSCHSGTISRGPGSRNIVRRFSNVAVAGAKGNGEQRDLSADNSYVTISGSLTNQLSYEDALPDPSTKKWLVNGFLTYYFVQNVRQNPGATYKNIISLVRSSVAATGKMQTPQVEGAIDRPAFGSAGSERKRAIAIKCADVDGKKVCLTEPKPDPTSKAGTASSTAVTAKTYNVTLEAGEIVGAKVGGPVAIYAPNAVDLTGTESRLALGTITAANAFASEAEVELTDPKAKDLPPLSRAVLLSPNFSDRKRSIAIDLKGSGSGDAGAAKMKQLSEELKKSAFFAPTESSDILKAIEAGGQTWQLAVVRGSYSDFKKGVDKRLASKEVETRAEAEQGYFISDQAGIPLYNVWVKADAADATNKIRVTLESYIKAENVRALKNEVSSINSKVKVEQIRYKGFQENSVTKTCSLTPYSDTELSSFVAGTPELKRSEVFHVKITNLHEKDLYFYVYSIDSSGAISLVFPEAGANELLRANTSYLTSPGKPCENLLGFSPTAPTGFETIKVLVSETPIEGIALTQPGMRSGKGADGYLESLLRQAGTNTRAEKVGGAKVDDWAAFNLEYVVVP